MSSFHHFSDSGIAYAASQGVPMASTLVPISGVLALLGGLSILLGFKAKWGAWLLVLFLIPVSLMMHHFWTYTDPMMRQMQQVNFLKNMGLLGGAFAFCYFGSGALSLDRLILHGPTYRRHHVGNLYHSR